MFSDLFARSVFQPLGTALIDVDNPDSSHMTAVDGVQSMLHKLVPDAFMIVACAFRVCCP